MVNLIHPAESSGESPESQREQQPHTKDALSPEKIDALLQRGRRLPANITEDLLERATKIITGQQKKVTREEITSAFTSQTPTPEQQKLREDYRKMVAQLIEGLPGYITENSKNFTKLPPEVQEPANRYAIETALQVQGRRMDFATFNAIHSQESRSRKPENELLIQQYDYQLAKLSDTITTADSALSSLQELRELRVSEEDREFILATASAAVSEKMHIPPDTIIELAQRKTFGEREEDYHATDLPIDRVCETIWALKTEWENKAEEWRKSWLETDLTDVDDLISRVNVSAAQKEEWKKMAKFDLPKDARIHVIPLIGGDRLPLDREFFHAQCGILAGRDDSKVTFAPIIDNMKLSKQEILQRIHEGMKADADIILFYDSTHGLTASAPEAGGFAQLGDEREDRFMIAGEKEIDPQRRKLLESVRDDIVQQVQRDLGEAHRTYFMDYNGKPMDHENGSVGIGPLSKTVDGQTYALERRTLRLGNDTKSWGDFSKYVLRYLEFLEKNISSEELHSLQRGSAREAPKKRFGYVFDACLSGSIVDEPLAKDEGTLMVLHSSQMNELSRMEENGSETSERSVFSNELFNYLQQGCTWGEAFVRADIKVNYGRNLRNNESGRGRLWQNPGASVHLPDGTQLRVSSVLDTPQKTEPNQERGLA